VNNLLNIVTQLLPRVGFEKNPRPVDRKSNVLPVAPPRHLDVTNGITFGQVPHFLLYE